MTDLDDTMPPAGRFITLEGGEGAGKSTLARHLAAHLERAGLRVVETREPGGTPHAEAVRSLVLTPPCETRWAPLAEALLMNAGRAEHLHTLIRPALERGDWVVCDRFSDSTLAYQSVGAGLEADTLTALEAIVCGPTRPDLTLLLDAAPEHLLARRVERGQPADVYERQDLQFHRRIRDAFLQIAMDAPERVAVLDATLDEQALAAAAFTVLRDRLQVYA